MNQRHQHTGKKNKKSWARIAVEKLHLWLGLGSGIVVLIVAVTGCLFVFQQEITEMVHHKELFVEPQSKAILAPSTLLEKAQLAMGKGFPINNIQVPKDPDRAWEFMAYAGNDTALTFFGAIDYYKSVYVNPYNGAITGFIDHKYSFFPIVKYIHWSLLLNTRYGQPIVGWSTFIFVILLITGLVLWWPKKWNKSTRERSFRIKWKAGFKRINYDLHNVLGFYAMLVALVISLTGMVWAFRWFEKAVYVAAAGTTAQPQIKVVESDDKKAAGAVEYPLDVAFNAALPILEKSKRLYVYPPALPTSTIIIGGLRGKETYFGGDELQFDRYSAKLLSRRNDSHKNRGERLLEMNYDIHVGAIGGLPGKIIAFIASLICASLPVTGFYVWWNKKKKTKTKISAPKVRTRIPEPEPVA